MAILTPPAQMDGIATPPTEAPVSVNGDGALIPPEAITGTWVITEHGSDGTTTYWTPDGDNALLLREGVAVWPNKEAAVATVRSVLGRMPMKTHKAIKLTEEQEFNIASPYRTISGELVEDNPPTEFSEMEPDEAINAANRWVRNAQMHAVRANTAMSSALECAWYAGSALEAAKARVKARGLKWIPWLEKESNFHGTVRLAQYYMALAKKRNTVSHLDHDLSLRSAIKQITATKPQPSGNKHQLSDSDRAAKKLSKQVAAKLTMINEAGTFITDLDKLADRLGQHRDHKPVNTFTDTELDTIMDWLKSLHDISLKLQALTKPAFTDTEPELGGEDE